MSKSDTIIDLDKYPKSVLQNILKSFEVVAPFELGIKDFYVGGQSNWAIPELGLSYKNTTKDEFERIMKNSTNENSVRRAYAKIYELSQAKPGSTEMKGADKYAVDPNTMTPEQLEEWGRKGKIKNEQFKQNQINSNKVVETAIDKKTEIANNKFQNQNLKENTNQNTTDTQAEVTENFSSTPIYISSTITETPDDLQKTETSEVIKPKAPKPLFQEEIIQRTIDQRRQIGISPEPTPQNLTTKESIQNSIDKKEASYQEQIDISNKLAENLQSETVYVEIKNTKPPILTPEEKGHLDNLKLSAKQDSKKFTEDLAVKYETKLTQIAGNKLGKEEIHVLAQQSAYNTTLALSDELVATPMFQTMVPAYLAKNPEKVDKIKKSDPAQKKFRDIGDILSNQRMTAYRLNAEVVKASLGEAVQESTFPNPENVTVNVTPQRVSDSQQEFHPSQIPLDHANDLLTQKSFLADLPNDLSQGEIKTKVLLKVGSVVDSKIAGLPVDSFLSKSYSAPVVQAALEHFGLKAPAVWATENAFGKLAISYGYGPTFGWLGEITGTPFFGITRVVTTAEGGEIFATGTSLIGSEVGTGLLGTGESIAGIGSVGGETIAGVGSYGAESIAGVAGAGGAETLAIGGSIGGTTLAGVGVGTAEGVGIATAATVGGVEAGVEGTAIAAGASTGPAAIIVIPLLMAVGTKVVKFAKDIFSKIKTWIKENEIGPVLIAGIVGLGATLFGGLGMGLAAGGLAFGGAAVATGGVAGLASSSTSLLTSVGTATSAIWATFMQGVAKPVLITVLAFPVLVIFILIIINNGAYVVPPGPFEAGKPGITPSDCLGDDVPKPTVTGVRYSSDGKFAYPVAPFPPKPYSECYHWDGNKAADLFSPENRPPIVASENGKIVNVTLNDSLGGKYIILQGTTSGSYYYHAHLCHVFVKPGDTVNVGDVIGTMDETGNGRVQHLHYAINSSPLTDTFIGGSGNVCPFEDFEKHFNFGICNPTNYCVRP